MSGNHELFRGIFGRGWWHTAARVLGITEPYAFDLGSGRYPMQRRHWRVLETYADQKRRARSQRQQRERDRLERQLKAEAQAEEEATLRLRAITAELRRQGLL